MTRRRHSTYRSHTYRANNSRLQTYFTHHRRVAKASLQRLLSTPFSSAITWLLLGIAMALPGMLFVGLINFTEAQRYTDGEAHLSLFINKQVDVSQLETLHHQLIERDDIASIQFISAEQALDEFQLLSGYPDVTQHLEENPLPAVLVVYPTASTLADIDPMVAYLAALPEIDQVVLDRDWLQRLEQITELGRRLSVIVALLLGLGVLLVIGSTIRFTVSSRHDEILMTQLLGGTDGFIRRPFLYTGLWYGLGGSIVAWLMISISVFLLSRPVDGLVELYDAHFMLKGLGIGGTLLLWLVGALLGWLGAWLAITRQLRVMRPR